MPEPMFTRETLYTKNNKPRTVSLIAEFNNHYSEVEPIFTVSAIREGYISLRNLYINLTVEDPTEMTFAETVFGEVAYWRVLRESNPLKPYLAEWRKVADLKRKQLAFESIVTEVKTEGKNSFQAAKYLIDEPWKGRTAAARKASKDTTKEAYNTVKDDVQRLKDEGYIQ